MTDATGAIARPTRLSARGDAGTLGWTAAVCIGVSLLVMLGVSAAGPSIAVPVLAHPPSGPPWWHAMHLSRSLVLMSLWAAAVIGAVGVIAGLLAVSRGARPRIKPLLTVVFLVMAIFTVLPPAGSTDTISYGIDGAIVAAGHSPYSMTPNQFLATGATIAKDSPKTWQDTLSDYGPLATGSEWAAAKLGGSSMARITFWLKLWTTLAFGAVILLLDSMLRNDPARRLRAHLLWSANPLLLWEIVAGGHIDGLAAAFGLAGIAVLYSASKDTDPGPLRALAAGLLIGAAIDVKSPFALFALAGAWVLRRRLASLGALALGALIVLVPSYALAGKAAIKVLFDRGGQAAWDNPYQLFWRPFGVNTYNPAHAAVAGGIACLALGVLLWLRLPSRTPRLPAVTPALALSMAWIFLWPFQRPWYDVMIVALLVLYPASRLDWVVLTRLCFAAITYMDALDIPHGALYTLKNFEGEWITPTVRLLTVIALVWLCVTGRWGWRERSDDAVHSPVDRPVDNVGI